MNFQITCGLLFGICLLLSGCASPFPTPLNQPVQPKQASTVDGPLIFTQTLSAHGGGALSSLRDINVSILGEWKLLITKIQPLVTDFRYRVKSEERLLLSPYGYNALYNGPAGTKKVVRTADTISVHYNGIASHDNDVLSSTALTADAFHLFLLGPLALNAYANQFIRISDATRNNQQYYRVYLKKSPGFGFSSQDEIVLWVNQNTKLTESVQITLTGHKSTKRAHVQVDYLNFITVDSFVFPQSFFEFVNAPIRIDAHSWALESIDINRGLTLDD